MKRSATLTRSFLHLRRDAQIAIASSRYWRRLAVLCAAQVQRCERDASDLLDAAARRGAEAIVECQREEHRRNADARAARLEEVLAWLDSPELAELERETVARLEAEREAIST